jgi:hypothetical protein
MGKRTMGVPQELGRSCRLHGKFPAGDTGQTTPGLPAARGKRGERTMPCNRGTAKRRQRSAAGRAAGRHSVLIVPLKLANSPLLEPVEGSETPDHGTAFEKHDECIEIRQACPRNRSG